MATSIVRLSTDRAGNAANGASQSTTAISADGRYVVFQTVASNLVAGDGNGQIDIFLRDLQTGAIQRVSPDAAGRSADSTDTVPLSLSADGRYLAFHSGAPSLVSGDNNFMLDGFVEDLGSSTFRRATTSASGGEGNDNSYNLALSADGRYVAFASSATNLVAGDTATRDIFLKDLQTSAVRIVSASATGVSGNESSNNPSFSANGRYLAFDSYASNLVAGLTDANGHSDIFVKDLQTGAIQCLTTTNGGPTLNGESFKPALSADGRYVVFTSSATNLLSNDANGDATDIFLVDTQTGTLRCLSTSAAGVQGNNSSSNASISADGRYVAFESQANNLVPGDTNGIGQIFVKDVQTGAIARVSASVQGVSGYGESHAPSISADGRFIVFQSTAANLTPGDTNGVADIFRVSNPFLSAGLGGSGANDILMGAAGSETIDGGGGIDTVVYGGQRNAYSVNAANGGLTVRDGGNDIDSLLGIERLQFADGNLAFDLGASAGSTAQLLCAAFGRASLANRNYVGIGLSLFDAGLGMEQVAQLAVGTGLIGGPGNAAFVSAVWLNLVGAPIDPANLAYYTALLDQQIMTQAGLLALAAQTSLAQVQADLVGLSASGLAYLPA